MRRYFDLTTRLLQKQITASPVVAETSTRGTIEPIELQFVLAGVIVELDATGPAATGLIGFKDPQYPDAAQYVVVAPSWVKTGSGSTTVYTLSPYFLSDALDTLIASNPAGYTLAAELQFTYSGGTGIKSNNAIAWLVRNDINRGYEIPTAFPAQAITVDFAPSITRLTGGVAGTDVDAQPVAQYPLGTKFRAVTDAGRGDGVLAESTWQKRTGTETGSDIASGVILCTDGSRLYRIAGL